MPATIIYKQGWPSTSKPIRAEASISEEGIITGSASFLLEATARTRDYEINSEVPTSLFTSLQNTRVEGLYVKSLEIKKQDGLLYLNIEVIGVIRNAPKIKKKQINQRSFSRTEQVIVNATTGETKDIFCMFDYLAESITESTIQPKLAPSPSLTTSVSPLLIARWGERKNSVTVTGQGNSGGFGASIYSITPMTFYLKQASEEEVGNLVRVTITNEFVYQ